MNIKIDKEKFDKLSAPGFRNYAVGSVLYCTSTRESDMDILMVVPVSSETTAGMIFQYQNGQFDYTIVDEDTFLSKAKSGDDLVCFEAYYSEGQRDFNLPKVVRAYSGIAFRDLKEAQREGKSEDYSERKIYHALRCQFIAETLISSGEVDFSQEAKIAKQIAEDAIQEEYDLLIARIVRLRSVLKGVDNIKRF